MSAAQLITTSPTWERDPEVEARIAYVRLLPKRLEAAESVRPSGRATSVLRPFMTEIAQPRGAARKATGDVAAWLSACYALTPRVERVSADAALLDLGSCTPEEALAAVGGLLDTLHAHGRRAVAGIGPSMTVAQLAVFGSPFPRRNAMALRALPPPSPPDGKGVGGVGSADSPSARGST
ncbi:MAG TPA: hypothetical protein VGR88_08465, partial [Ktedonobacterales bacterium]|nr:hypothetical protein [Ktedonobacterales bacterium]